MSQTSPSSLAQLAHNPVFCKFPRWRGTVPEGFIVNFLGVMTRTTYGHPYFSTATPPDPQRVQEIDYPSFDEEYFEWIDLMESVASAAGHFTMFELGAGWGRWTVNAAFALRQFSDLPFTFVAVEAEPSHFQSISQHLADNNLDPADFHLIEAAVTATDGTIGFQVGKNHWGDNFDWHGQSVGGDHIVNAISLRTLLQPYSSVDLIDLDIQGQELAVLLAAANELDKKVKKVHIGTHSRKLEDGLRSLFYRLGWRCVYSFPCSTKADTEWGQISFQDGVQTWINPAYLYRPLNETEVLKEKLGASRKEAERLWAELEKARDDQYELNVIHGSLGWKLIEPFRHFRDWLAPGGTRRRKFYELISKKIGR